MSNHVLEHRKPRGSAISRIGYVIAAGLSVWASASIVLPYLTAPAPPGDLAKGQAPTIIPSILPFRMIFPWLTETDRRLAPFAVATLCCIFLGLFVFPAVLGSRGAASDDDAVESGARAMRRTWVMWSLIGVVVMGATAAWNLHRIQAGLAPVYSDWPRKFSIAQELAMVLPALIVIPLAGLLMACVSTACGISSRQPKTGAVAAYVATLLTIALVGMLSQGIPGALDDFVPAPGLRFQNVPSLIVGWCVYALFASLFAAVAWYVGTQRPAASPDSSRER